MGCEDCTDQAKGAKGDDGTSSIAYIGYASDANGSNFSLIPSDTLRYISFVIKQTPQTSLTVNDFPKPFVLFLGVDGRGYDATSVTSMTIGVGSKTFTITALKAYVVGSRIRVIDNAAPTANYMEGVVTAYNATTGVMTATMDLVSGSGTYTDWNISIAGQKGNNLIYSNPVPVAATAGLSGSDQTIDTYTLPAGSFATDGDMVEVEFTVRSNNGTVPIGITTKINGANGSVGGACVISGTTKKTFKQKIIRYDGGNFSIDQVGIHDTGLTTYSEASNVALGGAWTSNQDITIVAERSFGNIANDDFFVENITIKKFIK